MLVQDARDASAESVNPGDEDRVFYKLAFWKRIIIMLGGPAMNLVLAVIFYAIVICVVGSPGASTTISVVSQCMTKTRARAPRPDLCRVGSGDTGSRRWPEAG